MTSQPPDRAADAGAASPWPGPDWVESQELWPAQDAHLGAAHGGASRAPAARTDGAWPDGDGGGLWPPDAAWPAPDLWGPQGEHTAHEEWPRSPAGGAAGTAGGSLPAAQDYPTGSQPAVHDYPSGVQPAVHDYPGGTQPAVHDYPSGTQPAAGRWPAAGDWQDGPPQPVSEPWLPADGPAPAHTPGPADGPGLADSRAPGEGQPGASLWPGPPQWAASGLAAPAGAAASAAEWPEEGWPADDDRPPGEHWAAPPAWPAGAAQAGTAPAEAVDIPGYPAQPGGTWGTGDFFPGSVPAPGPGQAIPGQAIPAQATPARATPGQADPGHDGPPGTAEPVQAGEQPAGRPAAKLAGADLRWVMAGYLTVPFFSFLVPLAVYIGSRGSPRARAHAAQAVNTAFTVLMYDISAAIMGAVLALDSPVVALALAGPLITALWLVSLVHLIRAASAAGRGADFRMPPWLCTTLVGQGRAVDDGRAADDGRP